MNYDLKRQLVEAGYRVHHPRDYRPGDPWDWIVRVKGGKAGCARRGGVLPNNPNRGKWKPMDATGASRGPYFDDPFAALAYAALQGWM